MEDHGVKEKRSRYAAAYRVDLVTIFKLNSGVPG